MYIELNPLHVKIVYPRASANSTGGRNIMVRDRFHLAAFIVFDPASHQSIELPSASHGRALLMNFSKS
jgi:hypothetical protein